MNGGVTNTSLKPDEDRCDWCKKRFPAKTVAGRRKRFCNPICGRRFHSTARKWAEALIASGFLTPAMIYDWLASRSSCTTHREQKTEEDEQ